MTQTKPLVFVFHFCKKEVSAAIKNLEWYRALDHNADVDCILAFDDLVEPADVAKIKELAQKYFRSVEEFQYPHPDRISWPAAPNHAWQNVARYMDFVVKRPWFWMEMDAIPIRPKWLPDIVDEYARCGKPFMGPIVEGMGHVNGVCVYPPNVCHYDVDCLMVEDSAWDVQLGVKLKVNPQWTHNVCETLFQHFWALNPATDRSWNGAGQVVSFKQQTDLPKWVNLKAAIFHRCKDGSLIDELRKYYRDPSGAMVPRHIPQPPAAGIKRTRKITPPEIKYAGNAEILIVTYAKDFPWLKYCLMALDKFCFGFSGVRIVVPRRDTPALMATLQAAKLKRIEPKMMAFDEVPGKGMLHHMVIIFEADLWCPEADIIVHLDSDCIFNQVTTCDEYVQQNKPVMLKRTYTGLYDPVSKAVSDCIQWKRVTEAMLGFETDCYTMCRHPSAFPKELYPALRAHLEEQHGPLLPYVTGGRNEFPQDRCEFPTLGAYAWEYMPDAIHWVDLDAIIAAKGEFPMDHQQAYHSHSGITPEIKAEIESWLK